MCPQAIWENQFYYLFGFLFLVFIILVVSCSQISIVMVYFQLCAEVMGMDRELRRGRGKVSVSRWCLTQAESWAVELLPSPNLSFLSCALQLMIPYQLHYMVVWGSHHNLMKDYRLISTKSTPVLVSPAAWCRLVTCSPSGGQLLRTDRPA